MARVPIKPGGGIGGGSDDCTALKAHVLKGYKAITRDSNDEAAEGEIPVNGAVNATLKAGESKNIPEGYTVGGIVKAASLESQTQGTAVSGDLRKGRTATVNGKLIVGDAPDNGNGATATQLGVVGSNMYARFPYGFYENHDNGVSPYVYVPLTDLGEATQAKVLAGETFTSTAGIKKPGTLSVQSTLNFRVTVNYDFDNEIVLDVYWENPAKGPFEGMIIRMSDVGYPGVNGGTEIFKEADTDGVPGGVNHFGIGGASIGLGLNKTYFFTAYSYATGMPPGSAYNFTLTTSPGESVLYWYGYKSSYLTFDDAESVFDKNSIYAGGTPVTIVYGADGTAPYIDFSKYEYLDMISQLLMTQYDYYRFDVVINGKTYTSDIFAADDSAYEEAWAFGIDLTDCNDTVNTFKIRVYALSSETSTTKRYINIDIYALQLYQYDN